MSNTSTNEIAPLTFQFDRSTKRTHKYAEVEASGSLLEQSDAVVGSLYVKKSVVGEKAPQRLRVTVEAIDG